MHNSQDRGTDIGRIIEAATKAAEHIIEAHVKIQHAHYLLYELYQNDGARGTSTEPWDGVDETLIDLHTDVINGLATALKDMDLTS